MKGTTMTNQIKESLNKKKGTKANFPSVKYHQTKYQRTPALGKFEDDDLDDKLFGNKQLGYFSSQKVSTCITVPIDEDVKGAAYYRQVTNAISALDEDDAVKFDINSGGGQLEGLVALLTSMSQTDAISIAHINGSCHSAASMLALNCDSVYVSPYASMMCHFVSYGSSGKASDIKAHVEHINSTCESLFRSTYELFLTEEEIEKCLNGGEIWLDSQQINSRLEHKYSILNAEEEAEEATEGELEVTIQEEEEWSFVKEMAAVAQLKNESILKEPAVKKSRKTPTKK